MKMVGAFIIHHWYLIAAYLVLAVPVGRMAYGHLLWRRVERYDRPDGPSGVDREDARIGGVVWGLLWPACLVLIAVGMLLWKWMEMSPAIGAEARHNEQERRKGPKRAEQVSDKMEREAGL